MTSGRCLRVRPVTGRRDTAEPACPTVVPSLTTLLHYHSNVPAAALKGASSFPLPPGSAVVASANQTGHYRPHLAILPSWRENPSLERAIIRRPLAEVMRAWPPYARRTTPMLTARSRSIPIIGGPERVKKKSSVFLRIARRGKRRFQGLPARHVRWRAGFASTERIRIRPDDLAWLACILRTTWSQGGILRLGGKKTRRPRNYVQ